MEQLALSIKDAGAALSLGRSKIFELIASGDLTSTKVGRRRLIHADSVRALIQRPSETRSIAHDR